jgi:ParB family chromosome partitioning protein
MQYKTLPISSININTRIRKSIGDISELAANIKEVGLIFPIVVNESNKLLAGERRLEACRSLGWNEIACIVKTTSDAEQDLSIEVSENIHRKDFTREEVVDVGMELERIEKVKAEERQATSTGGTNPQLRENFPEAERGRTRDIVARKLGMCGKQYEREKFIVQNKELLSSGDYDDWNNRIKSTNAVYTIIKSLLPSNNKSIPNKPKEVIKEVVKEVVPKDYENIKQQIKSLSSVNENLKVENSRLKSSLAEKEEEIEYLLNETDNQDIADENASSDIEQKYEELRSLYNKEVSDYKSQIDTMKIELDTLRCSSSQVVSNYKDGDEIFNFCSECNQFVSKIVSLQYSDAFRKISAERALPLNTLADSCGKVMDALEELIKHIKTDSVVDVIDVDVVDIN